MGCGHGLAGISLVLKGCRTVVFQDLNEFVLRNVTKPNLLAQLICNRQMPPNVFRSEATCGFISTSWKELARSVLVSDVFTRLAEDASGTADRFYLGSPAASQVANQPPYDVPLEKSSIQKGCFDYIIGSEVLYRPENYEDIIKCLLKLLRMRPSDQSGPTNQQNQDDSQESNGYAIFSTKRYYFGLGGGSLQFINYTNEVFDYSYNTIIGSDAACRLVAKLVESYQEKHLGGITDIIRVEKECIPSTSGCAHFVPHRQCQNSI